MIFKIIKYITNFFCIIIVQLFIYLYDIINDINKINKQLNDKNSDKKVDY